jgi:squalene-associated FAD-dependent desaturase
LAGLAAALAGADRGASVTLIERAARLGGATWSFERNGLSFDNGQHVFLRCCTEYRRFLERIGSADDVVLQDRLAIAVVRPGGRVEWIRRSAWPPPLHLAGALLTYGHLARRDRLRVARAAFALRRLDPDEPGLDHQSFGAWLRAHHQSDAAIEAVWDLFVRPTLNVPAVDASLALAATVLRTGLLTDASAGDIGWARVPLGRLHGDAASRALVAAGATVRTRATVTRVTTTGEGATRRVTGAELEGAPPIEADAVVLAVPHEAAATLLPVGGHEDTEGLAELGRSPIVNVHVVYDRRVMPLPMAAGLGTPVQWVFDRTESCGLDDGQCLAVSLSAADDHIGTAPRELIATIVDALADLFPGASDARVVDAVVTREHAATFRARPGTAAHRPGVTTAVGGLFLAGAWTNTGWPATMEGAVRSGHAAADAAWREMAAIRPRELGVVA